MSSISEHKSDVAEAARAFLSDITLVPVVPMPVVEISVNGPGRKRSPSVPDRHTYSNRDTAREFLMSIDLGSESASSSTNTSANATPRTPKSSPHKQSVGHSARGAGRAPRKASELTPDSGPGTGIAVPGLDDESEPLHVVSLSLGSAPNKRIQQRLRKAIGQKNEQRSQQQQQQQYQQPQILIAPIKPVAHRNKRAETVPDVFPIEPSLLQQTLQKTWMFVGPRGVNEACNQTRKTQKHVRLLFTSAGGKCPLITISYRLDKHVKNLPDTVPLVSYSEERKSFDLLPKTAWNWNEHNADLAYSDSDNSSLTTSYIGPRSFQHCMKATWTVEGFQPPKHRKMLDSWDDRSHRATVIAVNGFRCSILPYLNKHDAKEKMNEHFRSKHLVLGDSKIKVTKLRKHKMVLLKITSSNHLDVWTCALAFCFIDDVLKRGIVRKETLSLACACCYLLAAKFNEMLTPTAVKSLRDNLTKDLKLSSSSIFEHEFFFFSGLEFSLFRDVREVEPYLNLVNSKMKIVKQLELGPCARAQSATQFD